MSLDLTVIPTPIGSLHVAASEIGVVGVLFDGEGNGWLERARARRGGPGPGSRDMLARTVSALEAYFAGQLHAPDALPVDLEGTEFQKRVWLALRRIPAGRTASYREIAALLDAPRAVRAVGAANGRNPVPIILPCHRVIGASGSLVGYGGGLERKRWLLAHEGVLLPTS
ncbi:MAG: methylated-DNA--[protein]-cysteine S-methyltransferase [Acidobacteria bacterium]|nr:methylated-DNA--[protein]-cysteine S-methyltransferase [Acidobacteriota bacterium]